MHMLSTAAEPAKTTNCAASHSSPKYTVSGDRDSAFVRAGYRSGTKASEP